jgi:translation initiation factor 3 subunit A
LETARLQQQREEEAEARRQARAAEKAAEKAGSLRKPVVAPVAAAAKEETTPWRRPRADGQQPIAAARSESPAPPVAKYQPPVAGRGGWRERLEAKQAAAASAGGGGGSRDAAAPAPAVPASTTQASVPLKEETKLDDDGFQTVRPKEVWRPRRGRA